MSVIVLGSINIDLVVTAKRFPATGETLRGAKFFSAPGGKGANQAVAASRLSASTRLIGRVGDDAFGESLRDSLASEGIDVSGVSVDAEEPTGVALITTTQTAENSIVTVSGANSKVGTEELKALEKRLPEADVLLLQLEVPLETVETAAKMAAAAGVPVILDPAPVTAIPDSLLDACAWVTPNEVEAAALAELSTDSQGAERAASVLIARGAANVVVTLGDRGCYYASGSHTLTVPAPEVEAVDTVAAGDAFNGALAVAIKEGRPLEEALRWACAAGSLATTQAGAQPSLPFRPQVEASLAAPEMPIS